MIRLKDVCFSYAGKSPEKYFIDSINTTFEKGKITTIIGPNGSGKSTLLKLSARLLNIQKGKILINDKNLKDIKAKDFAKKAAVLSQNNFPPHITAYNYVMAGRYPYGSIFRGATKQDKDIVMKSMEMTGCKSYADKEINKLSGGEKQRVFIAMALAQDTEIIFLDEPITFLDINISYEIMDLIKRLNSEFSKTIILVLHDLNLAFRYSHNIILMQSGGIVSQGEAETIARGNDVNRVFGIKTKCFIDGNKYFCFDKE